MNDFYTYIQTCINICFIIQNGWETGNIIRFLCLSNLDALFTSLCCYLFYERGSSNEDIAFLGCLVMRNVDDDPTQYYVRLTVEVLRDRGL